MENNLKRVQLGKQNPVILVRTTEIPPAPENTLDIDAKLKRLEHRVASLEHIIQLLSNKLKEETENAYTSPKNQIVTTAELNKDGLPINMVLMAISKGQFHYLYVLKDSYRLKLQDYPTLSAAAEAASGCRRSGWTFWRTLDGVDVKTFCNKR